MFAASPSCGVLAIVLTCDAQRSLERCLRSLAAQTRPPERVLVVDNGATACDVAALGRELSLDIVHLPTGVNLGPAGGHTFGIASFAQSKAEWAWIMDDDCSADPRCLERLLVRAKAWDHPQLVFPQWVEVVSGRTTNYPAWCGFLLHRTVPQLVGVPRADFFWWAEDTEYLQWRMRRAKVQVCRDLEATVYHHRGRAQGPKPEWKLYYETRNTVYYHLWLRHGRRPRRLARMLVRLFGAALQAPPRWRRAALFTRAVRDGIMRRMGRRMPVHDADRPTA